MTKIAILTIAALALGGLLAGCGSTATDAQKENPVATQDDTQSKPDVNTQKPEEGAVTPVVFSNEKGEAVCPVMGDVVTDTKDAKFEDYNGKRYYFCCGDCPEKFHADPAKYEDGKALTPKQPSM